MRRALSRSPTHPVRRCSPAWRNWDGATDGLELDDVELVGDRAIASLREFLPGSLERPRAHHWQFAGDRAIRLEVHAAPLEAMFAAVGYRALLEQLHERLRPRTYVEVGVRTGASLGRAQPETTLIGIDPNPALIDPSVERLFTLFRLTSDDFFRRHDLRAELGGRDVDMAFIDGMHLFEFALRDFINLERCAAPDGVILVHDVCPPTAEAATRERTGLEWTGDVWKLMPCLREHRPDLRIAVVDVYPTGFAVIAGLDPSSRVLADRYDEILVRFGDLQYEPSRDARPDHFEPLDPHWAQIEPMLPFG